MKLIIELRDKDIGINLPPVGEFNERLATRAVVFSASGDKVALLHSHKLGYHILPGGGLEKDESPVDGLRRELLEEVGANVSSIKEIGYTLQWQGQIPREHKNYCYTAVVDGELSDAEFADDEIAEGYELLWVSLIEAVHLLETDATDDYKGKSNVRRDLAILNEAVK
jgi:8-oxo-dGTP diphosphatase